MRLSEAILLGSVAVDWRFDQHSSRTLLSVFDLALLAARGKERRSRSLGVLWPWLYRFSLPSPCACPEFQRPRSARTAIRHIFREHVGDRPASDPWTLDRLVTLVAGMEETARSRGLRVDSPPLDTHYYRLFPKLPVDWERRILRNIERIREDGRLRFAAQFPRSVDPNAAFDSRLAGHLTLWRPPSLAGYLIVDGFYRMSLANRHGLKPAVKANHVEAGSEEEARFVGRLQNIVEWKKETAYLEAFLDDTGADPDLLYERGYL